MWLTVVLRNDSEAFVNTNLITVIQQVTDEYGQEVFLLKFDMGNSLYVKAFDITMIAGCKSKKK